MEGLPEDKSRHAGLRIDGSGVYVEPEEHLPPPDSEVGIDVSSEVAWAGAYAKAAFSRLYERWVVSAEMRSAEAREVVDASWNRQGRAHDRIIVSVFMRQVEDVADLVGEGMNQKAVKRFEDLPKAVREDGAPLPVLCVKEDTECGAPTI
jgi:hypothetical protein